MAPTTGRRRHDPRARTHTLGIWWSAAAAAAAAGRSNSQDCAALLLLGHAICIELGLGAGIFDGTRASHAANQLLKELLDVDVDLGRGFKVRATELVCKGLAFGCTDIARLEIAFVGDLECT